MARGSDPAKVAQWKACLAKFQDSGQTVARFCEQEGVSAASFYQWRRKLAGMDQRPRDSQAAESRTLGKPRKGSTFQAVQILPAVSVATIRLPNGIEIELGGDLRAFDLLTRRLLDGATHGRNGQAC